MAIKFKGETQAGNVNMSISNLLVVFETTGIEITQTAVGLQKNTHPGTLSL